ncbi:hypothetical protein FA15DRAFT_700738 [Coprinopsis marcescibilis]|uniref:Uncharacterized protein n=1 Tax=Coprinopsis marcescibilis TaxID=230819 RepID=A0A5C3L7S6_COPMA|nr:hypothetical protein FA15DRAFT_700738 [Coprinopsis marcescibilis]
MNLFLKSWKKKDSKPRSSSNQSQTTTTNDVKAFPQNSQWPSASPTPSKESTSSTSTNDIRVPMIRLDVSASSSNDTFSSSVEDALHFTKPPHRHSPEYHPNHLQPPHQAHHHYNDVPRAMVPTFTGRHGAPLNLGSHGPPRNVKHGPPNVLQNQLYSINSAKGDRGLQGPYNQSPSFLASLGPQRQAPDSVAVLKPRTPTRVKFDPSVETTSPRIARMSMSKIPRSGDHLSERIEGNRSSPSHQSHRRDSLIPDSHPQQRRKPALNNTNEAPESGLDMGKTGSPSRGLGLYHSSQSSPHLPSSSRSQQSTSQQDLASLFPSPPPLIIRKKVPQPLVLQPRRPSTTLVPFPPSPSPDPSSTDSTPITTPTSSRQFSTPTQSPLKPSYQRPGNAIPPLLYDAPTSPLPSPPINPHNKTFTARQPTYSMQGRTHLRGAVSTSNLRPNGPPHLQTHRMTSSDPISDALQQASKDTGIRPSKSGVRRESEELSNNTSSSSHDPPVEWGYAL